MEVHRLSRQEGVSASRAGYRKNDLFLSWGESSKFLCRQICPKNSAFFCKLLLWREIYGLRCRMFSVKSLC